MYKRFLSLLIVVLLLMSSFNVIILPRPALAATVNSLPQSQIQVNRLGGQDRYATGSEIVKYGWQSTSKYAVIATGEDFPDALSATPLAAKYNAPILLTQSTQLNDKTKEQLIRLKVSNAFIVGGTGVVSDNVEAQLSNMGITVTRLWGVDRYKTSVKVAKEIGTQNGVVIATGENFPDALSIAPVAAEKGMPILLTEAGQLSEDAKGYITGKSFSTAYVIGGTGVVSDSVLNQIPNTKRLAGQNRYETNISVLKEFTSDLNIGIPFLATGTNYPDALSGSALAAMSKSPVMLVDRNIDNSTKDFIAANYSSIKNLVILGGEGVVPNSIVHSFMYDFENPGSATLANNVIVIDNNSLPQVQQEIQTVQDGDGTNSVITLSNNNGVLGKMKSGDIFYMKPTPKNPLGYSGKIVSASINENGNTVLNITQPSIDEVFSEFQLNVNRPLSQQDIIATDLPDGATWPINTQQNTASINSTFIKNDKFKIQSTVAGNDLPTFEYKKTLTINKKDLNLDYKLTIKQPSITTNIEKNNILKSINNCYLEFSAIQEEETSISGEMSGSYGAKQIKQILKQSNNENDTLHIKGINMDDKIILGSATFDIGVVPVQFKTGEPELVAVGATMFLTSTLEGKPEVTLSLTNKSQTYYKAGIKTQDLLPSVYGEKNILEAPTTILSVNGTLNAKFGAGVGVGIIAFGVMVGDVSLDYLRIYEIKGSGNITFSDSPPTGSLELTGSTEGDLVAKAAAGFSVAGIGGSSESSKIWNLFGPYKFGADSSKKTPFNEQDYYAANIPLGADEQIVIDKCGTPVSKDEQYEKAIDENIITLTYQWGTVELEHPETNKTYVCSIDVKAPNIMGPRNTQVGEDIKSVINKFRNDNYPVESVNDYLYKPLYGKDYNYVDGRFWATADEDKYGNITQVDYAVGGPGAGCTAVTFYVHEGKVSSYSIGYGLI